MSFALSPTFASATLFPLEISTKKVPHYSMNDLALKYLGLFQRNGRTVRFLKGLHISSFRMMLARAKASIVPFFKPSRHCLPTTILVVEVLESRSLLAGQGVLDGTIYRDDNGNGLDAADPGMAGVNVQLYLDNGDFSFDSGTDSLVDQTTSNAQGEYQFASLNAGTYFVLQTVPSGYIQIAPATTVQQIDLGEDQTLAADPLVNRGAGVISGTFYIDANANGNFDSGELPRVGYQVYLDGNGNALLDADEPVVETESNGQYRIHVAPGTYTVRANPPSGEILLEGSLGYLATTSSEDLFVLDDGSGNVLRISPEGQVSIEVTRAEILALTGRPQVDFRDSGLVADDQGRIFFVDHFSDTLLRYASGTLSILASEAALTAETGRPNAFPEGLTFGTDGNLYLTDTFSNDILQIDPDTGAVDTFVTSAQINGQTGLNPVMVGSSIVGNPDGGIYLSLENPHHVVLSITFDGTVTEIAGSTSFSRLDNYFAILPNGLLYVSDGSGTATIYEITPEGTVSVFLSEAQLDAATGGNTSLDGGIAFDNAGNFYLADNNSDGLYRFAYDGAGSGSQFVSAATIQAATGSGANLEGGIAFVSFPQQYNFGTVAANSIVGQIVEDLTADGPSLTDPGFFGVTVELYQDLNSDGLLDSGDSLLQTTMSDATGDYSFEGLGSGSYLVRVVPNTNEVVATSANLVQAFTFSMLSETATAGDVSLFRLAEVQRTVFKDLTGDGSSGDDLPFGSVLVQIYSDANLNGLLDAADVSLAEMVTGADGTATFGNLVPGNYMFEVVIPTYYQASEGSSISTFVVQNSGETLTLSALGLFNPPPQAVLDPVATISEGDGITLQGGNSSDPLQEPLLYEWVINGVSLGQGSASQSLSWSDLIALGIDDQGTYPVTLVVTDAEGKSDEANVSLTVLDVLPTFDLDYDPETMMLKIINLFDPSPADLRGGYLYEIDFDGDQQTDLATRSSEFPIPVDFFDQEDFMISVAAIDKDGFQALQTGVLPGVGFPTIPTPTPPTNPGNPGSPSMPTPERPQTPGSPQIPTTDTERQQANLNPAATIRWGLSTDDPFSFLGDLGFATASIYSAGGRFQNELLFEFEPNNEPIEINSGSPAVFLLRLYQMTDGGSSVVWQMTIHSGNLSSIGGDTGFLDRIFGGRPAAVYRMTLVRSGTENALWQGKLPLGDGETFAGLEEKLKEEVIDMLRGARRLPEDEAAWISPEEEPQPSDFENPEMLQQLQAWLVYSKWKHRSS
ncbi:Hypothetical protein PBC10988_37430 [Planctomycetales bacterium 10988]|nr:Hypothetical protein PBC10988_37430 [Planctomycetales bacterium 10988]